MVYVLVLISVAAMTAAQLLLKKGSLVVGHFPQNLGEAPHFFLKAYTNPYIIAAVFLTIVTALAWLLAVSKAELSQIYPFMALSYVLVALFSLLIFKEDVTPLRWAGIAVICIGVLLVSRS
jgi:drug/metabolite transporter (DMT)-like permease